jgi:hypothetical protein
VSIEGIMRKSETVLVQPFELLRSSQRRLLISYTLKHETMDCLRRTREMLEISRQMIQRSDALVERGLHGTAFREVERSTASVVQ